MKNESIQQSQALKRFRQQVSRQRSVDAPIGGWNTRDALDNVPEQDALQLDNYTCGLGAVSVRKGFVPHAYTATDTGHTASAVKTLMKYEGSGSEQLIAADGGALWLATSAGGVVPTATGYTSDEWSWSNFQTGAVSVLVMVNGTEVIQYTSAGGFEVPNDPDPIFNPVITPIGCATYKNRMYYWESGSQSVYYTDLYAYYGAVKEFRLGDVGTFGGDLVSVMTWTHDGGSGPDDYILFMMSSGEVLVYQGLNPEDEAGWSLVGIYHPGRPMGSRAFAKYGADLYIMTDLDIVPMSQLLAGVEANEKLTKISGAMEQVASRRGSFGFQATLFPPSKLMVFNVPGDDSGTFDQFVRHMVTGAWSRWVDIPAYCWIEYDGKLYFGSDDGIVYEAENGFIDHEWLGQVDETEEATELDYIYENPCFSGYLRIDSTELAFDLEVRVNYFDANGSDQQALLQGIDNGDQISFEGAESGATLTLDVGRVSEYSCPQLGAKGADIFGDINASSGSFTSGEDVTLTIGDIDPPTPGEGGEFREVPIKALAQTAWLRLGVEEKKQFDAVKNYFRSGVPVPNNLAFAVDYAELPDIPYPSPVESVGIPWSGEYTPPPVGNTIPDPTTWWTDEGSNPPLPVNDTTGESSVGAVTKWGLEQKTIQKWQLTDAGDGRAISMLMKTHTTEAASWILMFWHYKLGMGF